MINMELEAEPTLWRTLNPMSRKLDLILFTLLVIGNAQRFLSYEFHGRNTHLGKQAWKWRTHHINVIPDSFGSYLMFFPVWKDFPIVCSLFLGYFWIKLFPKPCYKQGKIISYASLLYLLRKEQCSLQPCLQ